MCLRVIAVGAIITILTFGGLCPAFAQLPVNPDVARAEAVGFEARHLQEAGKNPAGLEVTLRQPEGRTQFHMGEIIPFDEVFSSQVKGKYRLNPGGEDSVVVDRERDAPDVGSVNYDLGQITVINGAGPQWRDLESAPVTTSLRLNVSRRFDQPGSYRIYTKTWRAQNRKASGVEAFLGGSMTAVSNIVQIEILPDDPSWSAQMLAKALATFQRTGRDMAADPREADTLEYLDTPTSVQAIIDHYGAFTMMDSWNSPWYFAGRQGLMRSRRTADDAAWMQAKIADPQFPIMPFFIADLSWVQTRAAYPAPMTSWPSADRARQSAWNQEMKARTAKRAAFLIQNLKLLSAALSHKRSDALVHSAFTLAAKGTGLPISPATQKAAAPILISHFDTLAPDEQSALLDDFSWPAIRSPRMLPVLRRLYESPHVRSQGAMAVFEARQPRTLALRRIWELSPAEGRRLILAEIARPNPRIEMDLMASLPDATLPSVEHKLAANLLVNGDPSANAFLIQRYGARAILPQIQAFYTHNPGPWVCSLQAPLLAYFLRVAPKFGAAEVRKALWDRKDTDCYLTLFTEIAKLRPSPSMAPDLQKIAIASLADQNPSVASDAARALGAYGSPAAKDALWRRLRQLHAQRPTPAVKTSQAAVAQAIANSAAWLTDQTALDEILRLCPIAHSLNDLGIYTVDQGKHACLYMDVVTEDKHREQWRVGPCSLTSRTALQHKLAQYPRGTAFTLRNDATLSEPQAIDSALGDIKAFLKQRGMSLNLDQ
ncbi:hypothetical protein CCAX7_11430 [Capsulimonas corticalis]|uniref:Uncharacterized protein n=2 Tax=Capsulimonas corticalis TaxID=2219043 RepID=A0A9N7L0A5_9BACT|nr:hypothetical protein CCAX7_11430 [Capsulimonas corticalis]